MNLKKLLLIFVASSATNLLAQPTSNPTPPPTRPSANVISVYSDSYTNLSGTDFNPNWGQAGFATATTFTVSGNEMRRYSNLNYQGIQFANQNLGSMQTLHLDIWSADCNNINISLVAAAGGGERLVNVNLNLNSWNSIDIPLTDYTSQSSFSISNIFQFKFERTPIGGTANLKEIFVDNIYFYTTASLPTLSNFSIPSKMFGDAPFTITPPTSNSSGAFTYTSSNTSVATISGNTITITGGGTSIITATQAASGSFSAGSITANFTVSLPPLSTNAPTPTKPASNVISLFSDAYPNRTVETWRTSWSSATLTDSAISGNNIKKYSNLDFVGIEFSNPANQIDLSAVQPTDTFHVSMWTPDATVFRVKLVDFNTGNPEGEVWFTSRPEDATLPNKMGERPQQGVWNNYAIPMSRFISAGLTTRSKFSQLLFVGIPVGTSTIYVDNIYFSSPTTVLPVNFTSVTASKQGNGVVVKWNVAQEINVAAYNVEKSTNGSSFSTIASVTAKGSNSYSATDNNVTAGNNFYRIKAVDKDGKVTYSATTSINTVATDNSINVYPNPTSNNFVIKIAEANSTVRITNVLGQQVKQVNNIPVGNTTISVADLPKGNYTVSIIANGKIQSSSLVIQ